MEKYPQIELQVLISTLGQAGVDRISANVYPRLEEVGYLVSVQNPNGLKIEIPASLKVRDDFKFVFTESRGLSANRNNAIETATAPLVLFSDDDVVYSDSELRTVMESFGQNPDCDFLTFKFFSGNGCKSYPDFPFMLSRPPRDYYVSSIEMAFRRDKIPAGLRFNERFGIGAEFPSAEESIFVHDALKAGLKGRFIPEYIATHDHPTTAMRDRYTVAFARTKGAAFMILHPFTWPLRMLLHAWRSQRQPSGLSFYRYCRAWMSGVGGYLRW